MKARASGSSRVIFGVLWTCGLEHGAIAMDWYLQLLKLNTLRPERHKLSAAARASVGSCDGRSIR